MSPEIISVQDSMSLSVVETGSGCKRINASSLSSPESCQVLAPKPFSIKLNSFYNKLTNQNHRTAWISLHGLDWQTLVAQSAAQERS